MHGWPIWKLRDTGYYDIIIMDALSCIQRAIEIFETRAFAKVDGSSLSLWSVAVAPA
jgi:hypothetical protein